MTMKKLLQFTLIFTLGLSVAVAQGPPGGGPGGGRSQGDGNGRPRSESATTFEIPTGKGNSKISGFVVDSALTQAVEYATIALLDKATQKPVDGTIADDKGKFSLTKVAEGEYTLLFRFIGYSPKTIDGIKVEKGKDIDLGVIKMSASTVMLDAVTVTGEKSLIEEKVDRLVYNAEKDLTSKGGDAADVLRKVPMLSVDFDGNVQLARDFQYPGFDQ